MVLNIPNIKTTPECQVQYAWCRTCFKTSPTTRNWLISTHASYSIHEELLYAIL